MTKPVTAPGTPPDVLSVTMPATAAGAGVAPPPSISVCAFAPPIAAAAPTIATEKTAAFSLRPCASKSGSSSMRSSSSPSKVMETASPLAPCSIRSRSSRVQAIAMRRSLRSPFWIRAISRNRSAPASSCSAASRSDRGSVAVRALPAPTAAGSTSLAVPATSAIVPPFRECPHKRASRSRRIRHEGSSHRAGGNSIAAFPPERRSGEGGI